MTTSFRSIHEIQKKSAAQIGILYLREGEGSSKLTPRVFPVSYFGVRYETQLTNTSLSKKRPKTISRHKGFRLLVIEPVHRGSSSILLVTFLGHPVYIYEHWRENGIINDIFYNQND